MNYISTLTDKHFIRVEVLKNEKGLMEEVVILEEFYNKLSMITIDEVNSTSNSDNSNIFEIIEKEFGRTLSPMEYEIVKAWVDSGYSFEIIKEAVKEATFNGVSNLRYIDTILNEWNKKGYKNKADVIKDKNDYRKKKSSVEAFDMDWLNDI